jgi:hypothetical protein
MYVDEYSRGVFGVRTVEIGVTGNLKRVSVKWAKVSLRDGEDRSGRRLVKHSLDHMALGEKRISVPEVNKMRGFGRHC